MDRKFNLIIMGILVGVAVISGVLGYLIYPDNWRLIVQSIFSSLAFAGSIILITIYFKILRVRKTRFTTGIMVVAISMLISSIIDNPLRRELIQLARTENAWWFAIETVVSTIAVLTLVYLSKE
ncbi:MAG: hypothetical protein FK731_02205 [Asgard group archaeon]|nr:hypothetical protein [Asgard group archaeon]